MHSIWTLADVDSGLIKLIFFLVVVVFYVIKVATNRSKEQKEEESRRAAAKPKSAPQPAATRASAPAKGTAATEVDRFLEELARQSGVPVPPRQPAPPRPKPPVIVAPPHKVTVPPARAPAPAAAAHAPVTAVHHPPAIRPQPVEVVAIVEPEPVVELPAMDHLSPLAQAIVLREILGPCRALRPHRNRARAW